MAAIRYIGFGILCFYLTQEYWQQNTPTAFAWVCLIFMTIGAAAVVNWLIHAVKVAWLLACVAWGREP